MMMYTYYRRLLFFVRIIVPFIFLRAHAQTRDKFNLNAAASDTGVYKEELPTVIATIVINILGIVGVIFLLLIVYGGMVWMTSGGNEQRIGTAKKLLTSSVIGLVIVMTAYGITYFIIQSLTVATESNLPGTGAP